MSFSLIYFYFLQVFHYMVLIFHYLKGISINRIYSLGNLFVVLISYFILKLFKVLKSFECFRYAYFSDMRHTWETEVF